MPPADTARPPASHRRRFLIGLALAALVGVGIGLALLTGAHNAELRQRQQREAVVTLRALTDVVERAGAGSSAAPEEGSGSGFAADLPPAEPAPPSEATEGGGMGLGEELAAVEAGAATAPDGEPGEAVRKAVRRFADDHPDVAAVRVVTLEGIRLEASTDPADTGARMAPRRLERDEKPLYDLGQKLRAAVSENRENTAQGQAAADEELAIERRPDGSLLLSGPVQHGEDVIGMVQLQTSPRTAPAAAAAPWMPALIAWLAPVALLFLLGLALGERRFALGAAAAVLLLAALAGFAVYARQSLEAERRETGKALAAHIAGEAKKSGALLAELGVSGSSDAAGSNEWDVDLYRRPRGLVSGAGTVDEGKLGEEIRGDASQLTRSVAVLAVLALVLLSFIGFGGASQVGRYIVEYRQAYAYTLPAMLGMVLLVFFPFFYGVALSFTNANIYNSNRPITDIWVGLDNFKTILSDVSVTHQTEGGRVFDYSNFYWTLGFTIVWTISNVAVGVTLGLVLALMLNTKGLAFRAWYRVLLILPWALPNYITALIFKGMFHQQFGVINQIFQMVGLRPLAWFDGPLTSFLAVLTTNGWLSFPFMMVVSLGALQSIPSDLYEAARVDGATRWQQFRSITLPSLKPALVPAVILSVIWTFNQFNVIYLVSAGQPSGATEILITQAYKLAFEQYRYGYAAAYSMVIFVILLVYGTWQNRVTKASEGI
jgi:arabinogalactan oligomer/maltooligosaccharide transport system permease protein